MIFTNLCWLFTIATTVYSYPIVENLTEIIKMKGDAIKPIKGKHPPIGPGTDAGLYNEGFFEGDIFRPVSIFPLYLILIKRFKQFKLSYKKQKFVFLYTIEE